MKACDRADLVHLYLDGRLSRPERQELEGHLASCASCQRLLTALRMLEERLACVPQRGLATDLAPRIVGRLRQGPRRWVLRPSWALSSAALVLGILGLLLMLFSEGFWGPTASAPTLSGVELAASEMEIGVGEMLSYSSETADALLLVALTAGPALFIGGILLFAALCLVLARLLVWSAEPPPPTPTLSPGTSALR